MSTTTPAHRSVTADSRPQAAASRPRRRLVRAAAVGATVAANTLLWVLADALGVDFRLADSMGSVVLGLGTIVVATLVFALLGWGTLALLERLTRRARPIWTGLAITVVLLSMVPIFLEQATTGTRIALVLIHLAVGVVLVPVLRAQPSTPVQR